MTAKMGKTPDTGYVFGGPGFRFHYFSSLDKWPVVDAATGKRLGKLTDLVFLLEDPYPLAVGVYIEHGWGKPTQFVPWDKVVDIGPKSIKVASPEGGRYNPFVDMPRWIMLEKHLMGRTVLDLDGRSTEVVNDVHLLESRGRLLLVHVDTSFNGFMRGWGLGGLARFKDQFISWKFVQPLSVEDAHAHGRLALSLTRKEIGELPSEDLADMLEELSGEEQKALFNVLESEKAAETLAEAEPRAQRQIVSSLDDERAKDILSEMTAPQKAELFSALPHDEVEDLMPLMPAEEAEKVKEILTEEEEAEADVLMVANYVTVAPSDLAGEALDRLKGLDVESWSLTYLYVTGREKELLGVVDLREMVKADPKTPVEELMASPVVTAQENDNRQFIAELFEKYRYRLLPVTDEEDRLVGVVRYSDIM